MEAEDPFSRLPEGCVSQILSFTSPRDACRCSAVCKVFRSALESDMVWERFLPTDYPEILAGSVSPVKFTSKKELFFRLCDSILIENGQMSFSIERVTCRKDYTLSARKLYICWVHDPRYWKWSSLPESRFSEVAELLAVCWLEISGKIDSHILSPKTTYKAFLVLKFTEEAYGMGFRDAETSVKLGSHAFCGTVVLQPKNVRRSQLRNWPHHAEPVSYGHDVQTPKDRSDGWMEVEMGEFFNNEGEEGEVEMRLIDVKGGHWKRGLIVEGIEIRPV